jgi:pimeloyl-ACP methyl ester carboxylesterase
MQKRINDIKAKKQFAENGISLTTADFVVNGNVLHYAKTGADTLPTLFFVHGSPGSWIKFGKYLMDTDLLKKYRMISIDRPGFGYSNFGHSKRIQGQSDIISRFLLAIKNGKPVFAIGRSYGGPMIAKLAVDNPGHFLGPDILCSSSGS